LIFFNISAEVECPDLFFVVGCLFSYCRSVTLPVSGSYPSFFPSLPLAY
jgi:hypothetical protein